MIRWMILSTLATGLFYGLYCLILRGDHRLQLSRWYLIAATAFSMAFPFARLPEVIPETTTLSFNIPIESEGVTIAEIKMGNDFVDEIPSIYLLGVSITLSILIIQIIAKATSIIKLRRKYPVYKNGGKYNIPRGVSLILTPDKTAPYSFLNQIVVGIQDLSDEELDCILAHETKHVSCFHTVDLIAIRMIGCIAWFNPFIVLIARELKSIHEYQADEASLTTCSTKCYLKLLYRQATGEGYGHITNNFQSINIKKRIVMMKKQKTRYGAWKILAVLPLMALLVMIGCNRTKSEADKDSANVNQPANADNATVEPELFYDSSAPEGLETPEFPGGKKAFEEYLVKNINYPENAKANNIEGRVLIRFTVMSDGSIVNAYVEKGIDEECDNEALRIVKAMPKWKPAIYEGKPVNVQYALPIYFKLK